MGELGDVEVDWEVATDADFKDVVRSSLEHPTVAVVEARGVAKAAFAHSVHLEVGGLEPNTRYH